jgi:cell filamentation protein, protein adenylyltransferase
MTALRKTHPWLTFQVTTKSVPARLWLALGEARSKCEHLAGVPLKPQIAKQLHEVYLAKGVHATTAIEGNTLDEKQVLDRVKGMSQLPASQEYLGKEVDNVIRAANTIIDQVEKVGAQPLTPKDIKGYNSQILRGLKLQDHVQPGSYRTVDVGVMDYKAVGHADCKVLMERYCQWLNGKDFASDADDRIVYGIIKSIIAHVYLAWIHPFGDGNGRTARLLEVRFLMEAGIPSAAIHLLSNHYNATRTEYYRQLSNASKNGGDLNDFLMYAVSGFVDQLRQQLHTVKFQQWDVAWQNFVWEMLGDRKIHDRTNRRQIKLVLALSQRTGYVPRNEIRRLTPALAELYAGKTAKTLSRDINALEKIKPFPLIETSPEGVRATKETILAFLPRTRKGDFEAQLQEAQRLAEEAKQFSFDFGELATSSRAAAALA